MAKTNRGGRRATPTATAPAGTAQFQILQNPPNIVASQTQAMAANNAAFADTDPSPYHDLQNLRQYYAKQNLTIDQQIATVNYLSPTPETNSLYSMSQNLNQALRDGQPLTANQQYVYNGLMSSMHNIGENINLTRYDHDRQINQLLQQAGVNQTYDKLNVGQLRAALVGQTYGEERFLSTSVNNFARASASTKAVFSSRAVKMTYRAPANAKAMMPGNGPAGPMGELVLAPSGGRQNYKIVGVNFTGNTARRKGTQNYTMPQVELVVEITG